MTYPVNKIISKILLYAALASEAIIFASLKWYFIDSASGLGIIDVPVRLYATKGPALLAAFIIAMIFVSILDREEMPGVGLAVLLAIVLILGHAAIAPQLFYR